MARTIGRPLSFACTALTVILASEAHAVESSTTGLDIAAWLNADDLYNLGYTGSRVSVANVEGGHAWSAHAGLVNLAAHYGGATSVTQATDHATSTASAMAGNGGSARYRGIAYGSTLYSGAIANSINGNSFSVTADSYRGGFAGVLGLGGGPVADVVNMSWGNSSAQGVDYFNFSVDAAAAQRNAIVVVSSGNNGYGTNKVGSPARTYNGISVGALGSDTNNYSSMASFSSGGPMDYFAPNASSPSAFGVRSNVDLVAPGQNLTLAVSSGTHSFRSGQAGTSFSAPIVAGGMALLKDAAIAEIGGNATDARVLKTVAMNSARKISGWDNGQGRVGNTIRTTRALDFRSGAGALDVGAAYRQLTSGDTDLPGISGGAIGEIGWDFGQVSQGTPNEYFFDGLLAAGSMLTVTLNWFSDAAWGVFDDFNDTSVSFGSLDNLDLQVWSADDSGAAESLIAESVSDYDSTEHLSFEIEQTDNYLLRVNWVGELFDFLGDINAEDYALAWDGTFAEVTEPELDPVGDPVQDPVDPDPRDQPVPTPGALALFVLGVIRAAKRRRV